MQAVDDYIPTPARDTDKPFLMPVEDIFTIQGRGTVATGRIERGIIKVNEPVEIVGVRDTQNSVCTGVEMFKKLLDEGRAGDNVGLLLRGVDRAAIERGQVIAKPGTITPHTKFKAEAYVLTKEEGGRHAPFSRDTDRSFISERRTSRVLPTCRKAWRWSCREITSRWRSN